MDILYAIVAAIVFIIGLFAIGVKGSDESSNYENDSTRTESLSGIDSSNIIHDGSGEPANIMTKIQNRPAAIAYKFAGASNLEQALKIKGINEKLASFAKSGSSNFDSEHIACLNTPVILFKTFIDVETVNEKTGAPSWLKYDSLRLNEEYNNEQKVLELDGYFKFGNANYAVEYQGKQHYSIITAIQQMLINNKSPISSAKIADLNLFIGNYIFSIIKDLYKIHICRENGVKLYVIPYTVFMNKLPANVYANQHNFIQYHYGENIVKLYELINRIPTQIIPYCPLPDFIDEIMQIKDKVIYRMGLLLPRDPADADEIAAVVNKIANELFNESMMFVNLRRAALAGKFEFEGKLEAQIHQLKHAYANNNRIATSAISADVNESLRANALAKIQADFVNYVQNSDDPARFEVLEYIKHGKILYLALSMYKEDHPQFKLAFLGNKKYKDFQSGIKFNLKKITSKLDADFWNKIDVGQRFSDKIAPL